MQSTQKKLRVTLTLTPRGPQHSTLHIHIRMHALHPCTIESPGMPGPAPLTLCVAVRVS
jgi:hypothetical protein